MGSLALTATEGEEDGGIHFVHVLEWMQLRYRWKAAKSVYRKKAVKTSNLFQEKYIKISKVFDRVVCFSRQ